MIVIKKIWQPKNYYTYGIDRHSNWSSNSINNRHKHDRTLQVLYKHFIKALKLISTIQIKSEYSFIKKPSLHIDLNIKIRQCRNNIFRWMCRTTLGDLLSKTSGNYWWYLMITLSSTYMRTYMQVYYNCI